MLKVSSSSSCIFYIQLAANWVSSENATTGQYFSPQNVKCVKIMLLMGGESTFSLPFMSVFVLC